MRIPSVALALSFALGWSVPGSAQGTSFEGAAFLMLPVGAHGVSVGRAATATPGQESAFWNPAGLAEVSSSRVLLLHGESVVGTTTGLSTLFARPGVGTLAVSYLLLDVGDQEERDPFNNLEGTVTLRNHLAMVSASTRLAGRVSAGVSFKVARFELACRGRCGTPSTSSSTYAMDAGLQVAPTPRVPLRLGAMVAHLGPRFQHRNAEQADPLPTRIRLAAAYDVLGAFGRVPGMEGWLTLEVQERLAGPGSPAVFLGSEVVAGTEDRLFLRAGYVATDPDQPGGASVGFGLEFQKFEFSVAKSFLAAGLAGATDPFTAALSIAF